MVDETEKTEAAHSDRSLRNDREAGRYAVRARFDPTLNRVIVRLANDVEVSVPVFLIQELSEAPPEKLHRIEITPAGVGLHWPDLDADVYVPRLLDNVFGTRAWMAKTIGAKGGASKGGAKADAARRNGRLGGRPPGRRRLKFE